MVGFSFNELKQLIDEVEKKDGKKRILYLLGFIIAVSILFADLIFLVQLVPFISKIQVALIYSRTSIITAIATIGDLSIIAIVILCLQFKDWLMQVLYKNRTYRWRYEDGLADWEFQGNVLLSEKENAIRIIRSELGCIIKNRSWKNFIMKFDFKIPQSAEFVESPKDSQLERGFGIVFRAKAPGQYHMLKIDKSGYQPHVRNILWENNGQVSSTTLTKDDLGKWIPCELHVFNNLVTVKIGKDKIVYVLPTHSSIYKERGVPDPKLPPDLFIKVPLFCGSVGFRSAYAEEVFIRNLEVINA